MACWFKGSRSHPHRGFGRDLWALKGQVELQQYLWAGEVCRPTGAEGGHRGTYREFSLLAGT